MENRRKRTYVDYCSTGERKSLDGSEALKTFSITRTLLGEQLQQVRVAERGGLRVTASLAFDEQWSDLADTLHSSTAPAQGHLEIAWRAPVPCDFFREAELCGILSDIRAVWVARGSTLRLWQFERGEAWESLDADGKIVQVAVTPVATERWAADWMLIVSTPSSVSCYAVVLEPQLRIIPMGVTVRARKVACIAAMNGRVFAADASASVSELQSSNSWCSKRYKLSHADSWLSALPRAFYKRSVRKLAVDVERRLLYALILCSAGSSVEVFDTSAQIERRMEITPDIYEREVRKYYPELSSELSLIDIEALLSRMSAKYHFVAITVNGVRLYFSLDLDKNRVKSVLLKPQQIGSFQGTTQISLNQDGTFTALIGSRLICVTRSVDTTAHLQEHPCTLDPAWEQMAEVEVSAVKAVASLPRCFGMSPAALQLCGLETCTHEPCGWYPIADFTYLPPKQWLVLTASEIVRYAEETPVSRISRVLERGESLEGLQERYGRVHFSAWLLAVATRTRTGAKAKSLFRSSGDHQAVSLHLSRVLRPVWRSPIFAAPLKLVNERLRALIALLDESGERLLPFPEDASCSAKKGYADGALYQVYTLAVRCQQAIELVDLVRTNLRKVTASLSEDQHGILRQMRFREFVATPAGQTLATSLIESYIRSASGEQQALLLTLTTKAPSFFSEADAEVFCAEEMLSKAESGSAVQSALSQLLRRATSANIPRCVEFLIAAKEYRGAATLCLEKAKQLIELEGSEENLQECFDGLFSVLGAIQRTGDEHLAAMRLSLLKESCTVPCEDFHSELLRWLVSQGLQHVIPALDSPVVLPFLEQCDPGTSYLADYCFRTKRYQRAWQEYSRLASCLPQEQSVRFQDLSLLSLTCMKSNPSIIL